MPGASATRGVRLGLAARIFLASALLVVAVLGATFGVTSLRANRTANESIHRALANTRRAVTDFLGARTRTLAGLSQVSVCQPFISAPFRGVVRSGIIGAPEPG